MRALTLTQPWATLVALGHKRVETRSWATYRHRYQDVAIHAAVGGFARDVAERERELLKREPEQIPLGAIVAIARIGKICRTQDVVQMLSGQETRLGDYTWGRWAWQLDDIRALPEPIPCRGALGLWTLPRDIEIALERMDWERKQRARQEARTESLPMKATEGTEGTKG